MLGPVRDFVADSLAKHYLWARTGLRTTRFGQDEHAAIALALVLNGGPTGLKGADLQRLYERDDFDPKGDIANQTVRLLSILGEIADIKPGYIRTRWGLVDILLVLMKLEDEGQTIAPKEVMDFFQKFEEERWSVGAKLSDLQTKLVELSVDDDRNSDQIQIQLPDIPTHMLSYYLAFSREGANADNVETRSRIMYQCLLDYVNQG